MASFRHILFPVDFSDRSRAVRPFVEGMAREFGSKVTLLHVVETPQVLYGGVDVAYPISLDSDAMMADARSMLGSFFEAGDIKVGREVVTGSPAREVIAFAENNDVDLIMMGTHGYGAFRTLLLGSVAAKVLHDATCPVWTAAHTGELPEAAGDFYRTMMCAVDLGPSSLPLLRSAMDLANAFKSKMYIVHAVPAAENLHHEFDAGLTEFLLKTARESIAKLQAKAGTDLGVCVAAGPVSRVVREAAEHHQAGLVIAGRGHLTQTLGRLRSNAYSIIRESPCPVLSF